MRQLTKTLTLIVCLVAGLCAQDAANGVSSPLAPSAKLVIATPDELKTDIDAVPCKDKDRQQGVKDLFAKYGAAAESITVEAYKDVENVVVKLPGKSADTIIVGAHYDVAGTGSCGAIDNWTGIVTLAQLYRTFKSLPQLDKTLLFVGFGKEEQHLVGSRAMADDINKRKENRTYCAMVNIDSLGLTAPQIFESVSTNALVTLAEEAAKKLDIPISRIRLQGADTDSSSFLARKIPAVSLGALPNNWMAYLHTKNDQAKHVNPVSVYAGYRVALTLIAKINEGTCDAFREGKKK